MTIEHIVAGVTLLVFAVLTYGGLLIASDKQKAWRKRNDRD